ncbi:MAG: hypothetical protein ACR2J6_05995 [Thermoleophilaceae bacterium]
MTITQFRERAGPYFSDAVQGHRPLFITRGSAPDRAVLIGESEAVAMVRDRRFAPEVMRADGSVSVWLSEFALYGQGSSYSEARQDLLEEVREYVGEYLGNAAEYLAAPNRAKQLAHVLKAYLADARGELEEAIFPGSPDVPASAPPQRVAS